MMNKSWRKGLVALAVSAAMGVASVNVYASGESTGGVLGAVQTQTGSGVPNALVMIKNKATGLTRSVQTDASGSYRFPQLPIGDYILTVTLDGNKVAEQTVTVSVASNATLNFPLADRSGAEVIEVVGARPRAIDMTTTDSGLVLGEAEVDRLPVGRNTTEVALLAPGVVRGDTAFGNLPSFSGATVGENVYYINGFNLTNFRNGLGGSTVPFEFYKEFQLKTGGYSSEFGRSTGGVINAVSKSGTNEFQFDISANFTPDSLRSQSPDTYGADGKILVNNSKDSTDAWELNLSVGGPIIEDKLFFFALYNPRNVEASNPQQTAEFGEDSDDAFWGVKLDWYITDDHVVEFTSFSDETNFESSRRSYAFNSGGIQTGVYDPNQRVRNWTQKAGGQNNILKYTGNLTEDLTLQVMYGAGEADSSFVSNNDNKPAVQNTYIRNQANNIFTFTGIPVGPQDLTTWAIDRDERTAWRADIAWYINDSHKLKAGIDNEELESYTNVNRSGGVLYEYRFSFYNSATPSQLRRHRYNVSGTYVTKADAIYIEDEWQASDQWFFSFGLRNERFQNENFLGESFAEMDNQLAPRLAATFDVTGDGSTKLYANVGRYYLPVANNTNVRLAGNELFIRENFAPASFTYVPNGIPVITGAPSSTTVFSDGNVKAPNMIVDQDGLDPMYQDEYILGMTHELNSDWVLNVRGVYRDLKSTLEDMAVDHVLEQWAIDNGVTPGDHAFDHVNYILGNPGQALSFYHDFDDGHGPRYVTLSAEQLRYPESVRKYKAVELGLEHRWDGNWSLSASYTWSNSYGNNEGFVRSDNGQDDAGLTTLFDYPGLVDGAYGDLPNDRTHQIKVFGAYGLTDDLRVSYNFSAMSGRPQNCFGVAPDSTGDSSWAYGVASFYCGGELTQRGQFGRTDNVYNMDLGLSYALSLGGADATLRLDVFNVFDWDTATEVQEEGEFTNYGVVPYVGIADPNHLKPTAYQRPRAVRFSLGVSF